MENTKQGFVTKVFRYFKEASWQKLSVIIAGIVLVVLILSITGTTLKQLVGMNGDVKEINNRIEKIESRTTEIKAEIEILKELIIQKKE